MNGVALKSLEEMLQNVEGVVRMMRTAPTHRRPFQYPTEYGGWYDEQWAWQNTAVLFDQSFHMNDLTISGPDALKLLSDTGINDFSTFGKNQAKQFVAVNHEGYVIGDNILFGVEDDVFSLVGRPVVPNWLTFQAEKGGYNVDLVWDQAASDLRDRRLYRYQVTGPRTQEILESAQDRALEPIKFFQMGELTIAGKKVRALNHGMAKVPGQLNGLELMGPAEDAQAVWDAIVEAGTQFGLRKGGSRAYPTTVVESGWFAVPMPAIYTSDSMKSYREWLPAASMEGAVSLEGSFETEDIEDYYCTPWDLGYGRLIQNAENYIGRAALESLATQPHRRKVWLEWNKDDVRRIIGDALFNRENRPRIIDLPSSFSASHYDKVLQGDRTIGLSTYTAYTANNGCFVSLAMVEETEALDGTELVVVWGEPDGGKSKPLMPPHAQTEVRATLRRKSPAG